MNLTACLSQRRAAHVQHRAATRGHERVLKVTRRHDRQGDSRTVCPGSSAARLVVRGGVEPPTFRFSGGRSYQLSYLTVGADGTAALPRAVLTGFEPATFTLTG